jgi:hypothetical protein
VYEGAALKRMREQIDWVRRMVGAEKVEETAAADLTVVEESGDPDGRVRCTILGRRHAKAASMVRSSASGTEGLVFVAGLSAVVKALCVVCKCCKTCKGQLKGHLWRVFGLWRQNDLSGQSNEYVTAP